MFGLECIQGKMCLQGVHLFLSILIPQITFPSTSPSVLPAVDLAPSTSTLHTPVPSTSVMSLPGLQESQTQAETQSLALRGPSSQDDTVAPRPASDLKRKSTTTTESRPSKKKVKISMGPAVDLQD